MALHGEVKNCRPGQDFGPDRYFSGFLFWARMTLRGTDGAEWFVRGFAPPVNVLFQMPFALVRWTHRDPALVDP